MSEKTEKIAFVEWLEEHVEDRAMLAALRRGLGQPPGTVADTFRYVVPWIANTASPAQEAVYYWIGALFALYPHLSGQGSLGYSFGTIYKNETANKEAVERRFTALLAADLEDLDFYLRQAVAYLKGKEIKINWHQLFRDIQNWDSPYRTVQRNWARDFWGYAARDENNQTNQ